jgi:hypothetical protein
MITVPFGYLRLGTGSKWLYVIDYRPCEFNNLLMGIIIGCLGLGRLIGDLFLDF